MIKTTDRLNLPTIPVSRLPTLPRASDHPRISPVNPESKRENNLPSTTNVAQSPKNLVNLISDLCKGCELCVYACPTESLSMSTGLNGKGYHPAVFTYEGKKGPCTACGICYWICPDMAISEIKRLKQ